MNVHVLAVPVQAPVHPPNVLPVAAAAVSVTEVDAGTAAEQVLGQLMPDGDDVTVPAPAPDVATFTAYVVVVGVVVDVPVA